MIHDFDHFAALDALAWQIESGADEAIGDTPIDRLAFDIPVAQDQPDQNVPDHAQASEITQINTAALVAAECTTLSDLRVAIENFEDCALKKGAKNTVFADGNPKAHVMIIGEAPGRDEDNQGKPFVGRSGQLLDRMLAAIDLSRTAQDPAKSVYITNVLPWRPPQNRDPSTDETLMMEAFLTRHIELAQPKFIVTMGNPATKTVLGVTTGITRMRGNWGSHKNTSVLPMFHPAALLRDPLKKREAWADLLSLKAKLVN